MGAQNWGNGAGKTGARNPDRDYTPPKLNPRYEPDDRPRQSLATTPKRTNPPPQQEPMMAETSPAAPTASRAAPPKNTGQPGARTIVWQYMTEHPEPAEASAIGAGCGLPMHQVSPALSTLARQGRVIKTASPRNNQPALWHPAADRLAEADRAPTRADAEPTLGQRVLDWMRSRADRSPVEGSTIAWSLGVPSKGVSNALSRLLDARELVAVGHRLPRRYCLPEDAPPPEPVPWSELTLRQQLLAVLRHLGGDGPTTRAELDRWPIRGVRAVISKVAARQMLERIPGDGGAESYRITGRGLAELPPEISNLPAPATVKESLTSAVATQQVTPQAEEIGTPHAAPGVDVRPEGRPVVPTCADGPVVSDPGDCLADLERLDGLVRAAQRPPLDPLDDWPQAVGLLRGLADRLEPIGLDQATAELRRVAAWIDYLHREDCTHG